MYAERKKQTQKKVSQTIIDAFILSLTVYTFALYLSVFS